MIRSGGDEVAVVIAPGGAIPVAEIAGKGLDLLSLLESGRFYEFLDTWNEMSGADMEELSERVVPFSAVEYAPLYRRPRKIWGIGLNYVEHAGDLEETAPSEEPASFMRPDTTIIGPGEEIRLPEQSGRVTGEAELGLVIGREARNVSKEEAPSMVAGLTTVLDMTAEDILRKNPRYLTRAKSFDTFFSFGPQLVTLDSETRRENVVSNMTFSPWFLVSFHSKVMTLLPGDIISTGTPGAVEIQDGDTLSCHIDGFEPLSNPVVRR
jgi:2-keto-4-pentenoate hydratase/2-oxohepta-3-ene-1,7-dioic acid hydratase in catechol pathway